MPWKARVTSRFCSSQGLVQSFATRAKVASCTEKCSVSRSKKKVTAIFIPKCCKAQGLLPCGRFLRRRSLVLAKIPGLTIFLLRKRGLSLTLTASTMQRRSLNREDIECSSRTRKNHGAKSPVASSHRKDYWWALLLLPKEAIPMTRLRKMMLGKVFPFLAPIITPTRQEVFFFGTSAGDLRFTEAQLPTWIDGGKNPFFGVPGNHWRGFKIADDTRGPVIDPSTVEREISQEKLANARAYLGMRFPALANAPLLERRVCQYENSTDHNFILDRHPGAENVWIVGGGSGHGFKHGPVIGEMVTDAVLGSKPPPKEMLFGRLL